MSERSFESRSGRVMLTAGALVTVYGIVGLIVDGARTRPADWIKWFVAGLLAHDLVLTPAVLAVGLLVTRSIPAHLRGPVQGGLIASGIVTLSVYPLLRGYGRNPGNPSALPNDYAEGLGIVLMGIWTAVFLVILLRRRSPSPPARSAGSKQARTPPSRGPRPR